MLFKIWALYILYTDKTETLTRHKVVLEYKLNIHGEEDTRNNNLAKSYMIKLFAKLLFVQQFFFFNTIIF